MKITDRLFNKIIRHTHWYNDVFWNGALKFGKQTYNVEIVNLGSGAAVHAFNYEDLSVKGENWALSPQSLVHDFNILRNYFSYLKEGATVIITICPFSCLFSNYTKETNFKYYPFLHPATIIDFDDAERKRAFLTLNNPFKAMPSYCFKQTIKEFLFLLKSKVKRKQTKCDFKKSANDILSCWKKQFQIDDINTPLTEQHLFEQSCRKDTLKKMIVFCRERNLHPIIVIPPMHKELTSLFTKEFIDNYIYGFLAGIDVPIYDCMCCEKVNSDDYYINALFLNNVGSKVFTRWLVDTVNNH